MSPRLERMEVRMDEEELKVEADKGSLVIKSDSLEVLVLRGYGSKEVEKVYIAGKAWPKVILIGGAKKQEKPLLVQLHA